MRLHRWFTAIPFFALVVFGLPALVQPVSAVAGTSFLVPAYFYPAPNATYPTPYGYWDALPTAAGQVPVTAILNPNSGPGSAADTNYLGAVVELQAGGGRAVGYVGTQYTGRSIAAVESEVDSYASFYPTLNGIMLDEMTNDASAGHLAYYQQVYNYIKSNHSTWTVVANPGAPTQEAYLTGGTADTLNVFEGDTGYDTYVPSAWNANYDRGHFAHLPFAVASAATMQNYLQSAVARNAGYVYVTDDTFPNPWDTLPSYWNQEVSALHGLNVPEPPSGALAAVALACGGLWMGISRRRKN